ncbi:MAG TPA: penicillin acylase family protein [Terracidiphilus sp.]|nr:penicillin acylase family protein [Terracidiphilus sp.]
MAAPQSPKPISARRFSAGAPRRKWRRLRFSLWTIGSLVVLVALGSLTGLFWLRHAAYAALPRIDGSETLPGLSAPVTIRRDAHGVPHIEAATQDDLFMAQGYISAQDRLWQMDMLRRHGEGTLAAVLGPGLLRHDEEQRVLELGNVARRIYQSLPPAQRNQVDDYARGVNAYIAHCEATNTLPPEFKLLFYKPAPWTGVDSMAVGMTMVETLDTHVITKLARAKVDARLHNSKLESDLFPVETWRDHPPTGAILDLSKPQPPQPSIPNPPEETGASSQPSGLHPLAGFTMPSNLVPRDLAALLGLPTCRNCTAGSNNWVVAGDHTASGKPLLSNDMHLDLSVPNIWYIADLSAPGIHAAGVTLPGVPWVIAGHNEHIAWGFTALGGDVQDLYLEKLDGRGNYYQAPAPTAPAAWKPLSLDRETIDVRGGRNVTLDIRSTDHGPLLNPLLPQSSAPIALRWTLYDSTLNSIPLFQIDTASNWDEFRTALEGWCWPTQSTVYADDQGHIAYVAVGRIPIRSAGLTEEPIQNDSDEWQGYIPFDDMASSFDPPSGFLATANSRVTTEQSKYPLTLEWGAPFRVQRIYKLLQGRNGLTPQDMLATQTDIYSAVDQELAQKFAYAIDQTPDASAQLRQAANLMRVWDGRVSTDSAAASIVDWARTGLWSMILKPKLGDETSDYHWMESLYAEEQVVSNQDPAWLPSDYKNWNAFITAAVAKGIKDGHAPHDLSKWTYGSWLAPHPDRAPALKFPPLPQARGRRGPASA